ncbi:MAG: TolB family protein [Planctomycetota bacterium]
MTATRHAGRIASIPAALAAIVVLGTPPAPVETTFADELSAELKTAAGRIVYETFQDGNWELYMVRADGSDPVNLTRTPEVNELYPRVSPDGEKVAFVVDEGQGVSVARNVYVMSLDGTGRTRVAANGRQHFWNADGAALAYLKGESELFSYTDYATKGVFIYDLATAEHREHPNRGLHHLYNPCWTPDGKWLLATVHAGMGYRHGILAIEAGGTNVYNLEIPGCRPDVSPDGKQVAWGASDWVLRVGDLDFSGSKPKVTNVRDVVTSSKPMKVYHVDWSPDGRYLAFSRGPEKKVLGRIPEIVGVRARGWDICVADATATNRWIAVTNDGRCNKEPDWAP